MLQEMNVLWVDDDWFPDSTGALANAQFEGWEKDWVAHLASCGLRLRVVRSAGAQIADVLTTREFSAVVLDYGLNPKLGPDGNAFEAISRLSSALKRTLPPVLIFSKSDPDSFLHFRFGDGQRLAGAFLKSREGAVHLAECLAAIVTRRPLSLLVFSDLHAGFLPARSNSDGLLTHREFFFSLTESVRQVAAKSTIDAVVFPGDFAWRNQREDFKLASIEVEKIRKAAGVDSLDGLLFCPGNHDMVYLEGGGVSWEEYREFLEQIGAGSESTFFPRFVSSCASSGERLRRFDTQEASITAFVNRRHQFAFVGFNSCRPGGQKHVCIGDVNAEQWAEAEDFMKSVPESFLRIAALHHPVFSPPAGLWTTETPVLNQGTVMQSLARLGFRLVLHGHTHFAGVHSHGVSVINKPGSGFRPSEAVRMLVISCPSALAEPNPASPTRQYFQVRLGSPEPDSALRSFALDSFVFEPSQKTWTPGESIAEGVYRV